jgi:sporulation protein YlmC with PRC-barrel domain
LPELPELPQPATATARAKPAAVRKGTKDDRAMSMRFSTGQASRGSSHRGDVDENAVEDDRAALHLKLGTKVRSTDAVIGELADVVIDPIDRRVTHLVVQTNSDADDDVRLVPAELAADYKRDGISLACSTKDLEQFDSVREFAYLPLGELPEADPDWDVGVEDVFAMPTSGPDQFSDYVGELSSEVGMTYDRVPKGEVELRRSSAIESADGHTVGHIDGLIVDDGEITSLTLERGHLWWRRDIAIPVGAVARVESDLVTLDLSRDEVSSLPKVRPK